MTKILLTPSSLYEELVNIDRIEINGKLYTPICAVTEETKEDTWTILNDNGYRIVSNDDKFLIMSKGNYED